MRISSESIIAHPRDVVFAAYRDRLPEIAKYIPDVREIRVESRTDDGDVATLHNVWVADRELPAFARAFVEPEMLEWDDHAKWHARDHAVDWNMKTHVFRENVRCSGRNRFAAEGDQTKLIIDGDLAIDLSEIPGVPRIVAGAVRPKLEKFIVGLIAPNLERTAQAVQAFLDDELG